MEFVAPRDRSQLFDPGAWTSVPPDPSAVSVQRLLSAGKHPHLLLPTHPELDASFL